MTRFDGGALEGASELGYEQTLEALLSLIGRPVLVLFSGTDGTPFISGIVSGRLDRGELDTRLQDVLLRGDDTAVETLFFHVGSRQNGFVIRPDEFERGFWQRDDQLVVHLGRCAISVLVRGELTGALERPEATTAEPGERIEHGDAHPTRQPESPSARPAAAAASNSVQGVGTRCPNTSTG
jgi:hypothetical protein